MSREIQDRLQPMPSATPTIPTEQMALLLLQARAQLRQARMLSTPATVRASHALAEEIKLLLSELYPEAEL